MAKVSGALFSMEASGSYGGSIVFAKWKGRQYARQLVIPANPHSADQEAARNRLRVAGAIQKWVNTTSMKEGAEPDTDKAQLIAKTPGGYAWNGYLVDTMIGKGGLTYEAARTAFAALTAPQKDAWESAASSLTPTIGDVYQTSVGGESAPALTHGEAFFIYRYGLSQIGLANTPGAVPPTYA